ncbi:MAG: hypothetical protein ACRELV_05605 [Longimicrobiales bacterium]
MQRIPAVLVTLLATLSLGACDLVGDILEFGFWVLVIVVGLIVLVVWLIARRFSRTPPGPPAP